MQGGRCARDQVPARPLGDRSRSISYVMGAGEEGSATAISAAAEVRQSVASRRPNSASGCDVQAFCAGPVHALILAGALVESGIRPGNRRCGWGARQARDEVRRSALARHTDPRGILAGMCRRGGGRGARSAGAPNGCGRGAPAAAGSSQQALLEDIVATPLSKMGRAVTDIDIYATDGTPPRSPSPRAAATCENRNYHSVGRARRASQQPCARGSAAVRARPRPARVLAHAGPHCVRRALNSALFSARRSWAS